MSDRKYRQRGYQDEPREPQAGAHPGAEKGIRAPRPAAERRRRSACQGSAKRSAARAAATSSRSPPRGARTPRAARCGADLHACAQCRHFDTGAAFECQKPIPARISPKDARNDCRLFDPRTTVERETKSAAPTSARQAFDDLFK